jgi:ent-kaurene synthase
VHDALNFPDHANLQRLAIRRRIKHYATDDTRILKTSYRYILISWRNLLIWLVKYMCSYLYFYSSCHSCSTIGNQDFLKLAVEDFNICQSIQREEFKHIERCVFYTSFGPWLGGLHWIYIESRIYWAPS